MVFTTLRLRLSVMSKQGDIILQTFIIWNLNMCIYLSNLVLDIWPIYRENEIWKYNKYINLFIIKSVKVHKLLYYHYVPQKTLSDIATRILLNAIYGYYYRQGVLSAELRFSLNHSKPAIKQFDIDIYTWCGVGRPKRWPT